MVTEIERDRLRHQIKADGYASIDRWLPNIRGPKAIELFGSATTSRTNQNFSQLTPKEKTSATPNTYSGIYGRNRFPFHTDLAHWKHPPRYLVLRCIVGFETIATPLLDGWKLIDELGSEVLKRSLVKPRRPVNGKMPLLRLLDNRGEIDRLRWDEEFLRPASKLGLAGMKALRATISRLDGERMILSSLGDTLIIDNWRMLHAREPVPRDCETRCIERFYLEAI